jgi:hypothetical protein
MVEISAAACCCVLIHRRHSIVMRHSSIYRLLSAVCSLARPDWASQLHMFPCWYSGRNDSLLYVLGTLLLFVTVTLGLSLLEKYKVSNMLV